MINNFMTFYKNIRLNKTTYMRVILSAQTSLDKVAEELYGNVGIVEVVGNRTSPCVFLDFAQKVKQLCAQFDKTLIVYERLDIAKLVEADGVLLTQHDIPTKYVHTILADDIVIGSENLDENNVDYYILNSPQKHNSTKPCFIKTKSIDDFIYYTLFE